LQALAADNLSGSVPMDKMHGIIVHLEEEPANNVKDPRTQLEAISNPTIYSLVEDCMADRWDLMLLEACMPLVPPPEMSGSC
jgi:hypothetical protein